MKRFTLIFILCSFTLHSFSHGYKAGKGDPIWFFLSFGTGYGNSMYINNTNYENVSSEKINPAFSFGGRIGAMMPQGFGVAFEIGSTTLTQKYKIKTSPSGQENEEISKIGLLDKMILLRGGPMNSGYAELGIDFCSVAAPSLTIGNQYQKSIAGIVMGFGIPLVRQQKFDISIGLRAFYSFSDLMENGNYPWASDSYAIPANSKYSAFHPFVAELRIDASWHMGYFRQAKCNKRIEFVFF